MLIWIPSRDRADKQIAYNNLPDSLKPYTYIACPEAQVDAYREHNPTANLFPVPGEHERIAKKRQYLLEHSTDNNIIYLDDDVGFNARREGTAHQLFMATDEEKTAAFLLLNSWLDEGIVHCSLSSREGNNWCKLDWTEAHRCVRALAYRRDVLMKEGVRFDRNELMEDYDVCLQLLELGYPNRVSYRYCSGQPTSNTAGGCSTYRTKELQEQCSNRLAELHPKFVRVCEKKTKGAWKNEFDGVRIDVRVAWKKAYTSSKPQRDVIDGPMSK